MIMEITNITNDFMEKRHGMNLEAVTSAHELSKGSENIAEQKEWLKRKISGLGSADLVDMIRMGHGMISTKEELDAPRAKRGLPESEALTFSHLGPEDNQSVFKLGKSMPSYNWLRTDDAGFIKSLPLSEALDVLKAELLLRYEEKLDKLKGDSSDEEMSKVE